MGTDEPIRVLFATDCAYWQNCTGAQQRIFTLLKYLVQQSYVVETLYCGKLSGADKVLISDHDLQVEAVYDDTPPANVNVIAKLKWHFRGTIYWLSQKWTRLKSVSDEVGGRDLEDFRSLQIGQRFQQKLLEFSPQIVVVEYVSLAYLTEFVPKQLRQEIVLAVDTHDVMHSRCFQFMQMGHDHWIYLDEDQERDALQAFDLIIAIQDDERAEFQRILPAANIVVAKHAVRCPAQKPVKPASQVRVGYFGSSNASNESAIKSFAADIWPRVLKATNGAAELLVAGKVCDRILQLKIPNCTLIGIIDNVPDFYDQVEIVVNPVNFGTGLKIKNLEALAFGKCLVTTTAGLTGMPNGVENAYFVADSNEQFAKVLVELVSREDLRQQVSAAAYRVAQQSLNEETVYQPLKDAFEQTLRGKLSGQVS